MILNYIIGGLICGACYGVLSAVVFVFIKNVVVQIICDLLFCAVLGVTYLYITTILNLGQFRLYLTLIFGLSFLIERKTIGKLFALVGLMAYNWGVKLINRFKLTKVGRAVFK